MRCLGHLQEVSHNTSIEKRKRKSQDLQQTGHGLVSPNNKMQMELIAKKCLLNQFETGVFFVETEYTMVMSPHLYLVVVLLQVVFCYLEVFVNSQYLSVVRV
uniref:Uncharacterized protein n=1 Tax=Timema douglasi TaxID=61478 RepID=A0A7R8VSM4_TIMDO|nr:unnamed protein product [Timema douglasi]